MYEIWIALVRSIGRHAVERGDDYLRFKRELIETAGDRARDLFDVLWIVIIGSGHANGRLMAHRSQRFKHLVTSGGAGGGGILGIQRDEQKAVAPSLRQSLDGRFQGWIPISHAPVHDHLSRVLTEQAVGNRCLQLLGLRARERLQWTLIALSVPDRRVILPLPGGPGHQNQTVEDEKPEQPRDFDNPSIREKLGQVTPHRPVIGRVRGAEITQQDADFAALAQHLTGSVLALGETPAALIVQRCAGGFKMSGLVDHGHSVSRPDPAQCFRGVRVTLLQHDAQRCIAPCVDVVWICAVRHELGQYLQPAEQRRERQSGFTGIVGLIDRARPCEQLSSNSQVPFVERSHQCSVSVSIASTGVCTDTQQVSQCVRLRVVSR